MILPGILTIILAASLILLGARGCDIGPSQPVQPGGKPVAGLDASVPWIRDPSEDPLTFQLVWRYIERPGERLPGASVAVQQDTSSGVMYIPYPMPGRYHIAIFGVANGNLTTDFLCTGAQEIEVQGSTNTLTTSTGALTIFTPPTNGREGGASTQTSATSGEGSKTTLPLQSSSTAAESQPPNASQTHSSTRVVVAPLVGGVICGVLALASILFALRWYLRKRRSKAQDPLDIDPFPTHPSEPKSLSPGSDDTTTQQHSDTNQDDITARHIDRNPDAKVERQPPVHLRFAEDASSTTPAVQNGVDGMYVAPGAFPRPGIEVFTTDELAFALNQRLQEEGRWEIDESLPGYPDSDQGRSR
ncbi:hypothetical protein PQX77_007848 [Marasmius sp. AFHP31]|nr:hypothetical protein PQX77_007848 [Marasmius sp. AFHP31]